MFHRSERLLLRPPWPEDWRAVRAGIADEGIVRNLATAPWPYADSDAQSWCATPFVAETPRFLITLADSGEVIGGIGFGPLDVEEGGGDGSMELGYWIARAHWGRGYASEAARAVIEIARMIGHSRIVASHFLDNPASGRVLRKAGFAPTGKIGRQYSKGRGYEAQTIGYALDLAGDRALPAAA
ncbi:GNAT family N-acetyltransferase [Alteriqipengyuania lutimaris]|uniref:N-acetyltransferase n=1 Tax=Alteriqipengyuania lutimaris TaxID=1538146 RepID=A0A395LLA4_9SPHN|nr:GNAT family N-acetyltransferase [Alteriqipengyuania lutimaris]MBB3033182.1 RimJ/RimL family protein N-acetyltransferase [Alteriqipengyuania lutimaris]RDS77768.1 N-acetyltransferase [Alteriqipengyuania lutimaris]